jgi:hypothetical protein
MNGEILSLGLLENLLRIGHSLSGLASREWVLVDGDALRGQRRLLRADFLRLAELLLLLLLLLLLHSLSHLLFLQLLGSLLLLLRG